MDYSVDSSGHLPSLRSLRRRVPISLVQLGVDVVIIRRDSGLAKALRSNDAWQEDFAGPVEAVFVRR